MTTDKVREAFKWCREIGIRTHATIMICLPGEDWDSIRKTFKLLLELSPASFQASIAVPFPGTEFYTIAQEKGLFVAENFEDLAFSHYAGKYPIVRTEELSHEDLAKANRYANDVLPTLLKIEKAKRDHQYLLSIAYRALLHPMKLASSLRKLASSPILGS